MKLWLLLIIFLASTLSFQVYGQDENRPYYYYGNEKVYLELEPDAVAALVQRGTRFEEKYRRAAELFERLEGAAARRFETVLISKSSTSRTLASGSLNQAVATKEVAKVPVYRLGELQLIPQSEIIVQFKPDVDLASREELLLKFSKKFSEIIPSSGQYLLSLGNPQATLPVSKVLSENLDVDFAEPNFIIVFPTRPEGTWTPPDIPLESNGPLSGPFPSDPRFALQWYLENRTHSLAQGKFGADIRIRGAWDVTRGSEQIKVAVLDEGIDVNQPDLANNIARNNGVAVQWDAITGTDNITVVATEPHGTRVAGVIAASTDNGVGISGIAPNIKIIPIRMGSNRDSRESPWTSTEVVVRAIRKAVDLGADIINCSWQTQQSKAIDASINYAVTEGRNRKGVIMVFAAGNKDGPVVYPARLASTLPIIAVGATNSWDQVKSLNSNDGERWASSSGPELTLVAPGVGIATTDLSTNGSGNDKGYCNTFWGTSSAAPIVSGVVALILSIHPDWQAAQVKDQLIRTTDKIDGPNRTDRAGWGRVNACRAVGGSHCD